MTTQSALQRMDYKGEVDAEDLSLKLQGRVEIVGVLLRCRSSISRLERGLRSCNLTQPQGLLILLDSTLIRKVLEGRDTPVNEIRLVMSKSNVTPRFAGRLHTLKHF